MRSYLTIARDTEVEIEVKNSRFLCTLQRVPTESSARALVAALRKEHRDARHHCSAVVLGPDFAVQRSSDDGEPGVSDVTAVVTRWFGGTLLGAGGLVRAYGDAVRGALDAAGSLRRDLVTEFAISLDHGSAGRVEGELRSRGLVVRRVRATRPARRSSPPCPAPAGRRRWAGARTPRSRLLVART